MRVRSQRKVAWVCASYDRLVSALGEEEGEEMNERDYYENRAKELRRLGDRLKESGMMGEAQTVQMAAVDLLDLSAKMEADGRIIQELTRRRE